MPLALATMSPLESGLIVAVARRPLTARQLERHGPRREVEAALARLMAEGLIERLDGTRGRHREAVPPLVRLRESATAPAAAVRGPRQRAIVEHLRLHGATRLDALDAAIAGARMLLRAMARRGIVEVVADSALAPELGASAERRRRRARSGAIAVRALGGASRGDCRGRSGRA